ncbi:MAG: DUF4139 domain-containing protein [Methanotrichaceae archaeon]|nr:DUF4139 domain-containing protein [Methanotrichaceae archaeon]
MKIIAAILMLLLCSCAPAVSDESSGVEATTAITLPVDSVTVYPNGLMAVKRMGSLDVTDGVHKFVINVPEKADRSSVLLRVSNATQERVVYDANPVYTLNISAPGSQSFDLSYLMYNAAAWKPVYDLHLLDDSVLVKANAVVSNRGGEDLRNVRLKLVAGLPLGIEPTLAKAAPQIQQRYAEAATAAEYLDYAPAPVPATGELETLYIFELEGRKDLVMDKEIGFSLFQEESPLVRIYTWDAYNDEEGPAVEEIRANNTLINPWPTGKAWLYRNDEYVSTIEMPYTPAGTNASIVVGPSADLKVESNLFDYNITENIKVIGSAGGNHTVKETIEAWTYKLKIKSNLDRPANLEVTDSIPREAVILSVSPQPDESTATSLKWKLQLLPRQKTAINYTYQVTTTESLGGKN